ncbi:hypothetical protein [Sandaracinus amylolyticus]|uniref:Uncharacterized protein n=1 Tax=Sandaracinus amylolyticus TaxID=927083 RepID=A0A0F6YKW2_9BACT|nr:hypothetical protein [Sandaracinus amylolyticus]AKF09641.1 hypothetical protein DB32_006790 [Sandaracinus amylolyticus]
MNAHRFVLSLCIAALAALGGTSSAHAQPPLGGSGTIAPLVSYTVVLTAEDGRSDGTASEVAVQFRTSEGVVTAPVRFTRGVGAGQSVSLSFSRAPLGRVVEAIVTIAGSDGARVSVELYDPSELVGSFGPPTYVAAGSIALDDGSTNGDYGDCMKYCIGDGNTFTSCHAICRPLADKAPPPQ